MDPVSIIIKAIFTTIDEVMKLRLLLDEADKKKLDVAAVNKKIAEIRGRTDSSSKADWDIVKRGKKR